MQKYLKIFIGKRKKKTLLKLGFSSPGGQKAKKCELDKYREGGGQVKSDAVPGRLFPHLLARAGSAQKG